MSINQWITISYDWLHGEEPNPMPSVEEFPMRENFTVLGNGGGANQWMYNIDLEFEDRATAEQFEEDILQVANEHNVDVEVCYWDMSQVSSA